VVLSRKKKINDHDYLHLAHKGSVLLGREKSKKDDDHVHLADMWK
jgi:hypothetical protein